MNLPDTNKTALVDCFEVLDDLDTRRLPVNSLDVILMESQWIKAVFSKERNKTFA